MKVLYNNTEIKDGIFMTPTETQVEPKIDYSIATSGFYTLIMHDPDAPVGNYLHWVIVNIQQSMSNNGDILLDYKGPAPPKGSGVHKYIFLLMKQSQKIMIDKPISNRVMTLDELYAYLHTSNLHLTSSVYFTSKNSEGGSKKKTKNIKNIKKKTRNIRNTKKKTKKKSLKLIIFH